MMTRTAAIAGNTFREAVRDRVLYNLVLFALLLISQPVYFFWFELIPLNLLFIYLLFRQEKLAESLLNVVESAQNSA